MGEGRPRLLLGDQLCALAAIIAVETVGAEAQTTPVYYCRRRARTLAMLDAPSEGRARVLATCEVRTRADAADASIDSRLYFGRVPESSGARRDEPDDEHCKLH
jgi:type IV secretory pathway protease TraF